MKDLFSIRQMLLPLSIRHTRQDFIMGTHIGFTWVRVFGVLVAKIQRTKPWG